MKTHDFSNGQSLKAIYFTDGEDVIAGDDTTITVIMENGQMLGVPWALVEGIGGVQKWNLALVLGVALEAK